MKKVNNRRSFIKKTAAAGIGLGLINQTALFSNPVQDKKRIGMIGLDTSHSVAFTKEFNSPEATADLNGYKIVAAYPHGSRDIQSSVERIPAYTEEVKKLGVEIVDSIEELLKKVDVVLLETNDGRLHLEQALPVLKAGKRLFIDKPMAASLKDALAIFMEAERRKVPVLSCSSLRYLVSAQEVVKGKGGKVLGAFSFSPSPIEKTHPDFFWYGIHGVEILYTVMGIGCKEVTRVSTADSDVVSGVWGDGRIGTFKGIRAGKNDYGGIVFGEKAVTSLGSYDGYKNMLVEIVKFFDSGKPPITAQETIEILAFMEAADESKRLNGKAVTIESMMERAKK